MTNTDRVRAFIAAWERKDVDAIVAAMTPDANYHNIPMPPMIGHDAIRAFIGPFVDGADTIRFDVRAIGENADGVVFTERVDVFHMKTGRVISLPVMGVFEYRDGLIAGWRDYFDLADFQRQMA